jgi:MFS family permease
MINPRISLIILYLLRMFGLFLVWPVLSLIAQDLPNTVLSWSFIFAGYGITQILLQWPLGICSDRIGRKPIVLLGFFLSALGSYLAIQSVTGWDLAIARSVQGLGAISAVMSAWLVDHTPENSRTKILGILGALIGLSFTLCMMIAPALVSTWGKNSLFYSMMGLSTLGLILAWLIPENTRINVAGQKKKLWKHPRLLKLNIGVLLLHACQVMIFISVPPTLINLGFPLKEHTWMWMVIMILALIIMMPWLKRLTLPLPIMLLTLSCAGLWLSQHSLVLIIVMLGLFFIAFNVLEAYQPSQVSKIVGANSRGEALGLYYTYQSLGMILGGGMGAYIMQQWGAPKVWLFCLVLGMIWFLMIIYFKENKGYGVTE